ncbi:hypothetical protein GGS21DRAFT_59944 [Xylaria nigripes]|nr:hypothetical protein GGS21DRAFT_59944 [Xylaria nigripes]
MEPDPDDPVDQLFSNFPSPRPDRIVDFDIKEALQEFLKAPASDEFDYKNLLPHAKQARGESAPNEYFRQQTAHLAMQAKVNRKDKSPKAIQLKYFKWISLGMKCETYPFPTDKPIGPPSTTNLAIVIYPSACAACGNTGAVNLRCPSCNIFNEKYIIEKTAYCNKKCLQDHFSKHKPVCEGRVMMYRAAVLLNYIFTGMAEATFTSSMNHAEASRGLVYLRGDAYKRVGMTGSHMFASPSKTLIPSEELRRSLVCFGQSDEPRLSLYKVIKYIFKPFCKSIEIVKVQPRNMIRPMCLLQQGRAINLALQKHSALKLTLPSDETYVIDLTASQLGWQEILIPFSAYLKLRTSFVVSKHPLKPATFSLRSCVVQNVLESFQQQARSELTVAIVKEFESIVDDAPSCDSFKSVLKLPADQWTRVESRIADMIRQKIFLVVTHEYHRDCYRICLGPPPSYTVALVYDQYDDYKDVWVSKKEFDKLRNDGTDMWKFYKERREAKGVVGIPKKTTRN